MPSENNKTKIYIWNPTKEKTGNGSSFKTCGHVAVETTMPKAYYSLWPILPKNNCGFFSAIEHEFKKEYEEDCDEDKGEGRQADVMICLYTLHGSKIKKAAQAIKKDLKGWCALGTKKKASCASFAYDILIPAGLGELANLGLSSSKGSSSMTPGDMRELVISAKQQEVENYPEIKDFECPGETPIKSEKTGGCLVM